MVTLNLDKDFDPFFHSASGSCSIKNFDFSSGFEPHVQNLNKLNGADVLITVRFKDGNDLMRLMLANDSAKRAGAKSISVFIPFLPFARQDHLVVDGDPLSLRVFADIINLAGFKKVILFDPHSDVATAVINNSIAINNYSFVGDILVAKRNYRTASTDAGGYKKIFPLVMHLGRRMGGQNDIIICDKVRDPNTGKVISTTVNIDDAQGQDIYLIDDIVDGGYTFEMIGEELLTRNTGDIYLIASHWIGSKGEEGLKKYFKRVYTTNSVKDVTSDFVIQTNMSNIIMDNLHRINVS